MFTSASIGKSSPKTGVTVSLVASRRTVGTRSPELVRRRQGQEGSHEANPVIRKAKKSLDEEKYDLTPEGSSAGREGRHFTVANVGNNGRIYLR